MGAVLLIMFAKWGPRSAAFCLLVRTCGLDSIAMVAPARDLTERQQKVLTFICRTWFTKRAIPSARDLAHAMERKTSNPRAFLQPLVRKGYITTVKGQARNIRITDLGLQWYEMNRPFVQPELLMENVESPKEEQVELLLAL